MTGSVIQWRDAFGAPQFQPPNESKQPMPSFSITERLATQKRKKYVRRALLGALLFLTALAQNVPWLPGVFGSRALPLIPLAVCIAVLDQDTAGILFGAAAGILWDFTCAGFAWHGIYLTFIAFSSAMLMRYLFNRNARTIALLIFFSTLAYLLLRWLFDQVLPHFNHIRAPFDPYEDYLFTFARYSLPSLAYTMALAPLCYYLTHLIIKRTSRKQRRVKDRGGGQADWRRVKSRTISKEERP